MKKVISLVLSVMVIILVFASCSNNEQAKNNCNHEYTASVTKEATYDSTGIMTYTCENCGDFYTDDIEILTKPAIPTEILDAALSKVKYNVSMFSMTIGKLVNAAMDNYDIEYLSGAEAIAQGYLSESNIDDTVNIDNLYYAVVSGDCMQNPDYPYMTEYEEQAVYGWLLFDDNYELKNSGISVCENLHNCAVIIMTSSY